MGDGMVQADGTSIAVYFDTLEDLCAFMFRLFDSWNINKYSEFELQGLEITATDIHTHSTNQLMNNYFAFQTQQTLLHQTMQQNIPATPFCGNVTRQRKRSRKEKNK